MPVPTLTDARLMAMDALAPGPDDTWNVQATADAVSPPTLVVYWAEPWLDPTTPSGLHRACMFTARLSILAVAGRIDVEGGITELEQLVSMVVSRLRVDWPAPTVGTPLRWRPWQAQGTEYLAAEIRYRPTVYTPEGA